MGPFKDKDENRYNQYLTMKRLIEGKLVFYHLKANDEKQI